MLTTMHRCKLLQVLQHCTMQTIRRTAGLNQIKSFSTMRLWTAISTLCMYLPSANLYFENPLTCSKYCWAPPTPQSCTGISAELATWVQSSVRLARAQGWECWFETRKLRKGNQLFSLLATLLFDGQRCSLSVSTMILPWAFWEARSVFEILHPIVEAAEPLLAFKCLRLMMHLPLIFSWRMHHWYD